MSTFESIISCVDEKKIQNKFKHYIQFLFFFKVN